jgi:hypothetical protein
VLTRAASEYLSNENPLSLTTRKCTRSNQKTIMLSSLVRTTLRATTTKLTAASAATATAHTPATGAAMARYGALVEIWKGSNGRLSSSTPYAVDGPDGDHDLEDVEEHMEAVNRIIDVASFTEDADAITEMHDAVFGGKTLLSSSTPYAVDGPDGDHDLEDVEEHMEAVNRIIDVASVTEDADAITEMHDAVFGGKTLFAVDAPDGEHDLEAMEEHLTGVNRIINSASALEDPLEVKHEQEMQAETFDFDNSKY